MREGVETTASFVSLLKAATLSCPNSSIPHPILGHNPPLGQDLSCTQEGECPGTCSHSRDVLEIRPTLRRPQSDVGDMAPSSGSLSMREKQALSLNLHSDRGGTSPPSGLPNIMQETPQYPV